MDLPYRQRFQFLLELIYGETFRPKAFWSRHPDPDEFFFALFRLASPKTMTKGSFVGDVFELSAETLHNEVNEKALVRLGVQKEALLNLFRTNAAVEHPEEQGRTVNGVKKEAKDSASVQIDGAAETKAASAAKNVSSAQSKSSLYVPIPDEESSYRPIIPDGWTPGPTRGKRDRGSKGHSGIFMIAEGTNPSPHAATFKVKLETKLSEVKVRPPPPAKREKVPDIVVPAWPTTTATTATATATAAGEVTTLPPPAKKQKTQKTAPPPIAAAVESFPAIVKTKQPRNKRPRTTKSLINNNMRMTNLDGLVEAAMALDNNKEELERQDQREEEERREAGNVRNDDNERMMMTNIQDTHNPSSSFLSSKHQSMKLHKLQNEHVFGVGKANDVEIKNAGKSNKYQTPMKDELDGGVSETKIRRTEVVDDDDFDDAIPTLPLDDDDLDQWEKFDAWRAPLEEDDADCRAKNRTEIDRTVDVYSMFEQMNDLRSPISSQQHHGHHNHTQNAGGSGSMAANPILRDATARAQKLLGIEYVLKGMRGDLEQCLDDEQSLASAKFHLDKIGEIIGRKMNQALG
jgi:hypothetical protein